MKSDAAEYVIAVSDDDAAKKYPTVTARVPAWAREELEEEARRSRRSVAFIVRDIIMRGIEAGWHKDVNRPVSPDDTEAGDDQ